MAALPSGAAVRDRAQRRVDRFREVVDTPMSLPPQARLRGIRQCMDPRGSDARGRALQGMGEVGALRPRQVRIGQPGQDRPALVGEQRQDLAGEIGVASGLGVEGRPVYRRTDRTVDRRCAGAVGFGVLWGLRI